MSAAPTAMASEAVVDTAVAWWRLVVSVALMVLGASAMYVVSVVLPAVQSEFGAGRGDVSLSYALSMIGYGIGTLLMGRLTDRFGIMFTVLLGTVCMCIGFALASLAPNLIVFVLIHGLLIALLGGSATMVPLIADTTLWFERRRGIAVAICASGNFFGGAVWPPIVQYFVEGHGWRATYVGIAVVCLLTMLPLALLLRRRPPGLARPAATAAASDAAAAPRLDRPLGLAPATLATLLCVAGIACCVAMAMPQAHLVAYCTDLGYGAARAAEMLSVLLGFGIVSRLLFGFICDRIGGLRTLLLGSVLQAIGLVLFLPFDGLYALYVVSGLFGLFQGGVLPQYAIIVRENFPASRAGAMVGTVMTATMFGMALGGWMAGVVFDWTGSYNAAFFNAIGWNVLHIAIIVSLLRRAGPAGRQRGLGLDRSAMNAAASANAVRATASIRV